MKAAGIANYDGISSGVYWSATERDNKDNRTGVFAYGVFMAGTLYINCYPKTENNPARSVRCVLAF